jgi:hypothetical protein
MPKIDNVLTFTWPSFDLPGVRSHGSDFATYSAFPSTDGNLINVALDDEFAWLAGEAPVSEWSISFVEDRNAELSVPEKIEMVTGNSRYSLPPSFTYFIKHPELHRRIRSCTGCYLELPNWIVETGGVEHGYLIHFLSDQQWCLHWYLYINESGEQRILCSPCDYGFYDDEDRDEDEERPEPRVDANGRPDIAEMEMTICARSFSEFIYRFWIENEIWNANFEKRELTPQQQRYIDRLNGHTAE